MSHMARLHTDQRDRDREFRLIFLLTYPLFLLGAVIARVAPGQPAGPFAAGRQRSIFAEARAAAYRTIPYAF